MRNYSFRFMNTDAIYLVFGTKTGSVYAYMSVLTSHCSTSATVDNIRRERVSDWHWNKCNLPTSTCRSHVFQSQPLPAAGAQCAASVHFSMTYRFRLNCDCIMNRYSSSPFITWTSALIAWRNMINDCRHSADDDGLSLMWLRQCHIC